jgi:hypothetical protein
MKDGISLNVVIMYSVRLETYVNHICNNICEQ